MIIPFSEIKKKFSSQAWLSIFYVLMMLPLGIASFAGFAILFLISAVLVFAPIYSFLTGTTLVQNYQSVTYFDTYSLGDGRSYGNRTIEWHFSPGILEWADFLNSPAGLILMIICGALLLFLILSLASLLSRLHGKVVEKFFVEQ